jgi:hypothetical protein
MVQNIFTNVEFAQHDCMLEHAKERTILTRRRMHACMRASIVGALFLEICNTTIQLHGCLMRKRLIKLSGFNKWWWQGRK